MQYADNRELRARMYRAYATRAAEFHDGSSKPEFNNTLIIQRMLELTHRRRQDARLQQFRRSLAGPENGRYPSPGAGFPARTGSQGETFRRQGHRRTARLRQEMNLGLKDFQPWDAAYVSEKLLQARYAFSEQEVKQYFTEPKVLGGPAQGHREPVQRQGQAGYGASLARGRPLLQAGKPGRRSGRSVLLDLYARETKRGGAWMDEAARRRRGANGIQKPIAYLNCNFSRPVGGKPATFTHDDVTTLFHEPATVCTTC